MHRWLVAVAILLLSLPALADAQGGRGGGPGGAPARPVAGNGVEVPGWWARLDDPKEGRTGLRVTSSGGGVRIVTGPNAIFFDPEIGGDANYTVRATFTQNKPASHEVAYGLFIGGSDLDLENQRYTYFVIRQDGKFLIRKRNGAKTMNVAGDWADHPAVAKADASGKQVNELAISVEKDAVTFMANGQVVAKHPATAVDTNGIAGVRIGHGLDIQVDKLGASEGTTTRTN
jgi:hypothetical protein